MNVDEAAAGDVTGVHSALQIAPGAVGTAEVVDGSLRLEDVVRFSQERPDRPAFRARKLLRPGPAH